MKVCLLNAYPLSFRFGGGVESVLYSLNSELVKRGIETEVVSLSEAELKVVPPFARVAISLLLMRKLLKSKDHFDVIHSHGWAACLLRCIRDKPTVATSHGTTKGFLSRTGNATPIYSSAYNSLVTVNLERIGFSGAQQVTAVSHSSMRELIENYGIPEERITVVYNGIDVKKIHRVRTDLRDKIECEHLLLFMGRLVKTKGIEVLINALPMLKDYDFKLVVAGEGRDEASMRSLVSKMGLDDRVIFAGTLESHKKLEYLSASDAFIFPSFSESFGMALLDAMACKTPIVASRVSSIPEVVGDCGVLVKPRDPAELSKGIRRLLDNKKAAKKFATNAYERLISEFTVGKMTDGYMEVYEEVLE